MVDNGSMRTRLDFIAGRHELLHLYFVLCDVAVDCYGDSGNLEEGSSLSRLVSCLSQRRGKTFIMHLEVYFVIFLLPWWESFFEHTWKKTL